MVACALGALVLGACNAAELRLARSAAALACVMLEGETRDGRREEVCCKAEEVLKAAEALRNVADAQKDAGALADAGRD